MKKVGKDNAPKKRAGRPPQNKESPKPYNNGWFVICDPKSGKIVSVEEMQEPENNEVKLDCLQKVIHKYKNVDLFIHDLACKLEPTAQEKFPQIKYWSVDRFHGAKHNTSCK